MMKTAPLDEWEGRFACRHGGDLITLAGCGIAERSIKLNGNGFMAEDDIKVSLGVELGSKTCHDREGVRGAIGVEDGEIVGAVGHNPDVDAFEEDGLIQGREMVKLMGGAY